LLLAGSILAWRFVTWKQDAWSGLSNVVAFGIEGTFAIGFLVVGIGVLRDLCRNQTQLQRWSGERGDAPECSQGFREVCGRKALCSWCVPTPAFGENPFE
jgi:hypothetical protein